jgi:uncharacterized iron-regulated membrane protein
VIRTPLRKLVFQIHLWSGILLGLYVVVVCASGSALVFRNDIYDWLETGGKAVAYKGSLYHWLSWLGKLHGTLLVEDGGMTANAVGGFLLAALCLTGIMVWWRSALTIRTKAGWKRFVFDLHGVLGFWTFAVLLMWGLTGGYFVFPQPFRAAINFFTPIGAPLRRRPLTLGARILRGFSFAHYGNFAGWEIKLLWVILGLAPAVLFWTALVMWWNRVLAPALRRFRRRQSTPAISVYDTMPDV